MTRLQGFSFTLFIFGWSALGFGCGGSAVTPTNKTLNPTANAVISSGGATLAYVLDFKGNDQVTVYIPSASRYATLDLLTGTYGSPTILYYSGTNCTGAAIAANAGYGEVGKTVMFDGTTYWVVASIYSSSSSFSYQSYSSQVPTICTNSSGSYSITATSFTGQLTSTTQPYNFSAIAPLSISYP